MSTFGIIICCLVAIVAFIMVAPFVLTTQFSNLPGNRNGIFLFHWIHPRIALVKYHLGSRTMELRLLGWAATVSGRQKVTEMREAVDGHGGAEQKNNDAIDLTNSKRNGIPRDARQQKTSHASRMSQSTAAENAKQEEASKTAVPEDSAVPDRFTWSKLKKTIAILRQGHGGAKIYRWCMRLLRLSLAIIRFDHFRLYAKAGVEDPAETGKFYGYFAALHSTLFSSRKNMDVRLEPQFLSNVLEFEGSVGLKSSIAAVVMPVFVALVTFPYITVFFVWRRLKKVYTLPKKG